MALLLTESDVAGLLPTSLALEAVEEVFRWQGEGRLTNRPRVRLFESQGVAMEDVAVAARLVARAREQGVGREIPI